MATKIFVNLPVNDLKRFIEFFTQLGFSFNPQFTDETATCMVVSEDIFVMLLNSRQVQNVYAQLGLRCHEQYGSARVCVC